MASMDDLIATISSTGVSQQSADLKELHSALASTLQRGPSYRPIPPNASGGPHTASAAAVPPAPASSWNDQAPAPSSHSHIWGSGVGNSPRQTVPMHAAAVQPDSGSSTASTNAAPSPVPFTGSRETGFAPRRERPHHSVLPANASPAEAVGFANDAFRPLWDKDAKSPWSGFHPTAKTS